MALAGFALLLLPGLAVVRAPWTAVAPLSLAFWTLSAWWPPFASHGRSRLLAAALFAALLLAALRLLPRHEVAPPPGWREPAVPAPAPRPGLDPPPLGSRASWLVLAVALLLLLPVPAWRNAPGARLAFQTTTARLALWHDGLPWSGEPLLPLEPVAAHAPALATLVADLSLVARLDPGDAASWVLAAAVAPTNHASHARSRALSAKVIAACAPPAFLGGRDRGSRAQMPLHEVQRTLLDLDEHASQILADDAEREELHAGEEHHQR